MNEYDFYLDKICKLNTYYKPEGKADYFSYMYYIEIQFHDVKNDLIKCLKLLIILKERVFNVD